MFYHFRTIILLCFIPYPYSIAIQRKVQPPWNGVNLALELHGNSNIKITYIDCRK